MSEALDYFYLIFNKSVTYIFETCNFNGVSVGWIIMSCVILSLLIRSILNIPRGARLTPAGYSVSDSVTRQYMDVKGRVHTHTEGYRKVIR